MGNRNQSVFIGDTFNDNQGNSFTVIDYENAKKVTVKYNDEHGCELIKSASDIQRGKVKNPFIPSVCGVGFMGFGKYKTRKNGESFDPYRMWIHMMIRCYSESFQEKSPTYRGCSVINEWHNYQNFAEWLVGNDFYGNNYHLDKDILITGNKIYQPDACVLVPAEINGLLLDSRASRGKHLIGVCFCKNKKKYKANLSVRGRQKHLGYFSSEEEAHQVYVIAKEKYVKEVAEKWRGKIDDRAFEILMNWRVECDE